MAGRRCAFTLIEVLVALSVSAVILAVAGVSLHEVSAYEQRSRVQTRETRQVERLRSVLSADLRALSAFDGKHDLVVEPRAADGAGMDRLVFVTGSSVFQGLRADAEPPPTRVRRRYVSYLCEQEPGGWTLLRLDWPPGAREAAAVPVLRGLNQFSIEPVFGDEAAVPGGVERAAPDVLCFRVGFTSGSAYGFRCRVGAPHRLRTASAAVR